MSGEKRTARPAAAGMGEGGERPRPSRRSLLRSAAGVAGAGLAAGTVAGGIAAPAGAAARKPPGRPERTERGGHAGPVVVHVRDTRTGEMEIFSGTSQATLRDPQLARRLAGAVTP